jgi:hypothetical protein
VCYENGRSINAAYWLDEPKKRAVGYKLPEGMEVPAELGSSRPATVEVWVAGRTYSTTVKPLVWFTRRRRSRAAETMKCCENR